MNLRGGEQIIPNDVSIALLKVLLIVISLTVHNRQYTKQSRFADGIREEKTNNNKQKCVEI